MKTKKLHWVVGAVVDVLGAVLSEKVYRATKYMSPQSVVRATRTRIGGKFLGGGIEITLSVCPPNYAEREFIKLCKKAGEKFPVKKVQLKFLPQKKALKGKRK